MIQSAAFLAGADDAHVKGREELGVLGQRRGELVPALDFRTHGVESGPDRCGRRGRSRGKRLRKWHSGREEGRHGACELEDGGPAAKS
jgi:hypothetical protein